MSKSKMLVACAVVAGILASGCAAESDAEDNGGDEGTGTDSSEVFSMSDFMRRLREGKGVDPDAFMQNFADHARVACRMTRDASGQLSGPYGLLTLTVTMQDGTITAASLASPHAGTALGNCIVNDIFGRNVDKLQWGKPNFTRTKRFTIERPGKG